MDEEKKYLLAVIQFKKDGDLVSDKDTSVTHRKRLPYQTKNGQKAALCVVLTQYSDFFKSLVCNFSCQLDLDLEL